MTKIIISIVAFLLTIFPFSQTLLATHQQLTYPGHQVISDNIIDAVKSNDVHAIEDMFSESTKNDTQQLSDKIQNIYNLIDGEIISANFVLGTRSESSESGMGYVEKSTGWKIEFKTTTDDYFLLVCWVIADTLDPENVGLSQITLFDSEGYNKLFGPIAQVPITKS